jgi:hypothetical protein
LARVEQVIDLARRKTVRYFRYPHFGANLRRGHQGDPAQSHCDAYPRRCRLLRRPRRQVRRIADGTRQSVGTPSEIELYQSGSSARIIEGARRVGDDVGEGRRDYRGGFGRDRDERQRSRIGRAGSARREYGAGAQCARGQRCNRGSFEAYKSRVLGRSAVRLPEIVITAVRKTAPPARLSDRGSIPAERPGFGAGPVDNIIGRIPVRWCWHSSAPTRRCGIGGIPGPQTQARLSQVCGY